MITVRLLRWHKPQCCDHYARICCDFLMTCTIMRKSLVMKPTTMTWSTGTPVLTPDTMTWLTRSHLSCNQLQWHVYHGVTRHNISYNDMVTRESFVMSSATMTLSIGSLLWCEESLVMTLATEMWSTGSLLSCWGKGRGVLVTSWHQQQGRDDKESHVTVTTVCIE